LLALYVSVRLCNNVYFCYDLTQVRLSFVQ